MQQVARACELRVAQGARAASQCDLCSRRRASQLEGLTCRTQRRAPCTGHASATVTVTVATTSEDQSAQDGRLPVHFAMRNARRKAVDTQHAAALAHSVLAYITSPAAREHNQRTVCLARIHSGSSVASYLCLLTASDSTLYASVICLNFSSAVLGLFSLF